jgi:prepilin-type N-terminal cleavage/methylation domain-containing protein
MTMKRRSVHHGYTLIELLVVLGIIAVLASLGIGGIVALTTKGELKAQTQLIRSLLRRARNTAREERYPAIIHFDYQNNEIRARTRETLAFYRFETDLTPAPEEDEDGLSTSPEGGDGDGFDGDGSDEDGSSGKGEEEEDAEDPAPEEEGLPIDLVGALNIEAKAFNTTYTEGKIGTALLFGEPPEATTFQDYRVAEPSYVEIEDRPSLNPVDGIFLELWVRTGLFARKMTSQSSDGLESSVPDRPEEDAPFREAPPRTWPPENEVEMPLFTVIRKGKAFEISITADNSVEVVLSGPNKDGDIVTFAARTKPDVIREEKWARIGLAFDGEDVTLFINGMDRELGVLSEENAVLPQRLIMSKGTLRISDNNPRRAFYGVIDEVRISGLILGDKVKVPASITLVPGAEKIRFDAFGQLDPTLHSEAVSIQLSDDPNLQEKLFPGEERKSGIQTVVRGKDKESVLNDAMKFRKYRRRARRLLKTVNPKGRREVVVDMHGTLR